jgi:hypothetical protein
MDPCFVSGKIDRRSNSNSFKEQTMQTVSSKEEVTFQGLFFIFLFSFFSKMPLAGHEAPYRLSFNVFSSPIIPKK